VTTNLSEKISAALSRIRNNRLGLNVLEAEMVRDVATTVDGKVRLTVLLAPSDDAQIVREMRQVLEQVPGVTDVRVDVKDAGQVGRSHSASGGNPVGAAPPGAKSRALPVIGQEPKSARAAVPAPTPVAYPNLGNVVAISSGKGGVGKSTVAVNLAVSLAARGARIGLMDADIYGPNVPRMLGVYKQPIVEKERIIPLEAHGIKLMSLGLLIERDQPAIWRGPIIMKIVTQFLRDVDWGNLDFLFVDMPPGTGDAQLSLVQATHVSGALIVTTPQDVAAGDSLRGANMFRRVDVPILGVIENMSWFDCDGCGKRTALFGSGGGARLAGELGVPLLGQIPLYPPILEGGDKGTPIVVAEPESTAAMELTRTAERVSAMFSPASSPA
jgi:ATP-binding protein involved in chromosome partitioning